MRNDVKILIKFGEQNHMRRFRDGNFYFSNALRLRGIEKDLNIKGQGDQYEGKTIINWNKITLSDGSVHHGNFSFTLSLGPADKLPVFCMYSCFEKDCYKDKDGTWRPQLGNHVKTMVNNHFPKADTVVIVNNPEVFVTEVKKHFGDACKAEIVKYAPVGDSAGFLMNLIYSANPGYASDAYFSLLRKDTFFSEEQEFRFILSNREIETPQEMHVKLSPDCRIEMVNLNDFFASMSKSEKLLYQQ